MSNADLDSTATWFRDTLYKALSWGTATGGVLAAWLVAADDEVFAFSYCVEGFLANKKCSGAYIVTICGVALTIFWIYSLNRLWRRIPPHDTRISQTELNWYAALIAAAGLGTLLSAVYD